MRLKNVIATGSLFGMVLLAGLIAGVFSGGCGKSNLPVKTGENGPSDSTIGAMDKPAMDGWPKPALAIVFSGEQNGYLEPCGCTKESQMGGLSHRADLFRIIRDKGWPVTALDLGNTISRTRKQDQIKLQVILKAFQILGYQAAALGQTELAMCATSDFLLTQPGFLPDDAESKSPYVGANIDFYGAGPRKHHVFEAGGLKIGVVGVVGKRIQLKILPKGSASELKMTDPKTAIKKAVSEFAKQKLDLKVLLSYASFEESRQFAKDFPEFDIILTAGGTEDGMTKPEKIGNTLLLNVGTKGKHVGVLGFYPDDKKQRFRFENVDLDVNRFKEVESMRKLMEEYQTSLKDNLEDVFKDVEAGQAHPSGMKYVGAARCGECHTTAYDKWKTTKHARAYEGLLLGRQDQRDRGYQIVKRHHDPECLSCHVTGWSPDKVLRYKSGFLVEELAKQRNQPELFTLLKGQQCESCHGPGHEHGMLEEDWLVDEKPALKDRVLKLRGQMRITLEQAKKRRTCDRCHDLDNSPNFKFEEYWKKVEHKGKD